MRISQAQSYFCENVKGLAIHDRGRTFKVIKKAFEQIGYTVYDKVLNSKDLGYHRTENVFILWLSETISTAASLSFQSLLILIHA